MACVYTRSNRWNEFLFGIMIFAILGSNSQMAPVAAGNAKLLERGSGARYRYVSTVTLNEPVEGGGKDVGYQILGDVAVAVVWENHADKHDKLLELEFRKPKLLIKSRKAPTPEGFVVHASNLEKMKNSPYLIHWKNGRVKSVYLDDQEELSMTNIKRGISSLFQFQLLDTETKETDASGHCLVQYRTVDPYSFTKTKTDCISKDVPYLKPNEAILQGIVNSNRTALYVLSKDLTVFESVTTSESHDLRIAMKRDVGGSVSSRQELTFTDTKVEVQGLKSKVLAGAVKEYESIKKVRLSQQKVEPEMYLKNCEEEECPSLPKLVKDSREALSSRNLGTLKSAAAFLKVLSAARTASKEDIAKAFKGTKNREILSQLCDLAGSIQSPEAHDVVMKILNFDAEEDAENVERYLWALSVGSHPHEYILRDLYKKSQAGVKSEKVSESLILSLASMARKYYKESDGSRNALPKEIGESLVIGLEKCADENCKSRYLRALKNLKCPRTLKTLIKHALEGRRKASVGAMKAIRSFDKAHWSEEVLDAAQRIYFQAGKRFDSSSRTLAVDIILESNPTPEVLKELVDSLRMRDPAFEVKQYLLQRLRQLSEECTAFWETVQGFLNDTGFRNYHAKAQRGLTTAFTRTITASSYRNASLVSVQEMQGGFLKRGLVDVVIQAQDETTSLFTLGLFAGGLSSFVSSSEDKSGDEEEEPATAGMELSVLGTQLRPFVFFTGQGELMGHVWSGTASEKTPAYQALIVTQDQLEYISLQNGLTSQLQLLGVVSFDLSGQVQMSLWNRNAHSLVEKNAGIFLQGTVSVDTSFVRSKVEFNMATEVKLNLQSDLDFYSDIALCMQLSQPESLIRHNIHKIERIPGSKHRLRKSKYKKSTVPGRSYALNRKNNEMCNLILKDK